MKIGLFLVTVLFAYSSFGQTDFSDLETKASYKSVTSTPAFPGQPKLIWPKYDGGKAGLDKYVNDRIEYPSTAKQQRVRGTVVLSYSINPKGEVTDVVVSSKTPSILNEELAKVIKSSGPWIPGTKNGRLVKMKLSYSYDFK